MQKTDLNVSPYYDDFSEDSLFHRVLFRPAYSVQARELTQMQTILQNQIERLGSHFFKEGAVVIPGQTGFDITYSFVKLQTTFTVSGTTHTTENFRTSLVGTKLTGTTTGVIAKVVNTVAASGSDDLTVFVKYESSGTVAGGTTKTVFGNGESLTTDTAISYTSGGSSFTIPAAGQAALTSASDATGVGSSASVQKGIFYIRGAFVQALTQTIILDKYSNSPSYRIGFSVTESLITPEENTGLLDNATGSTNFAAKGAHRLKYVLTLAKKALGTADDADFIELMTVKSGRVQSQVRATEYSVLEDTLARRTFDESGDYIVRGFDIDMREHFDDGLNDGVFTLADGGDSSKIAIGLSPGKAYVRGFEIGTLAQTFIPLSKARETNFVQNSATTFSAGNFVVVENVFGTPDITSDGNDSKPFKEVQLRDQRMPVTHVKTDFNASAMSIVVDSSNHMPQTGSFIVQIGTELIKISSATITTASSHVGTATLTVLAAAGGVPTGRGWGGTGGAGTGASHVVGDPVYVWGLDLSQGTRALSKSRPFSANASPTAQWAVTPPAKTIGVARTRAFEHLSGTEGTEITGAYTREGKFQHYLFDVRMLAKLTLSAAHKFTATNFLHNGARIKGSSTGATGIVYIAPQDIKITGQTVITNVTSNTEKRMTLTDTGGLEPGMGISDPDSSHIADDNYIVSVDSLTQITTAVNSDAAATITDAVIGNATDSDDGTKLDEGTTFHIIQTTGTFAKGETITSNITGDLATGGTLDATATPTYYGFNEAHSIFGVNSQNRSYIADLALRDTKKLTGTVSVTGTIGTTYTVQGTNTQFASDLKVGDCFEVAHGTTQTLASANKRMTVKSITNNTSLITEEVFGVLGVSSTSSPVQNSIMTRVRARIEEQEELVMISKLPKQTIKTLKAAELNNKVDTTLKVRRQETKILQSGVGSITLPEGESFVSVTDDDYVISVVAESTTAATMKYPVGTMLKPTTDDTDECYLNKGAQTITLNLAGGLDTTVKFTYTLKIGTASEKTKTLQPMNTLNVTSASGGIYGTNYKDEEITLTKADVFKVRGVFMSGSSSTAAVAPTMAYSSSSGGNVTSDEIFQAGEKITGSNGSIARIISGGSSGSAYATASFTYLTSKVFTVGTTLTSAQSTFTYILTITDTGAATGVTAGDEDILSNYQFDSGMRDTFYDIGSITRKSGEAPPSGRLLIVYDYFTHGAGNYFSVDSYPVGASASSITYDEIPLYSAQRVDPDTISPTGEYDLRDAIDFRPRLGDYNISNVFSTGSFSTTPFSFAMRSSGVTGANGFESSNASLVDVPKTDDTFDASFNYYLPQNAALWLDSEGDFKTVVGAAAENPENPVGLEDAMQIAEFRIPQYTFAPSDIGMRRLKNRRFTMRDIGKISERVENLEYYSQLNMLEKDTESFQIQDADGLDRFKNGFIVDNFTGHSVGNALHPDYSNSMDMANGILRPEFKHRMLTLEENVSTDALRTAAGYRKTGDLLTLPYTEVEMVNQPYASRIENVNPFNVMAWIGSIDLDPSSDIWKDTSRMPNLVVNREGNYDSFIARNGGSAVNTVWNEWETFWSGTKSNSVQWRDQSYARGRAVAPYRRIMETTVTTTTSKQSRGGVRTEITPRIDLESKGDRVVSTEILPYCRARTVNFTAKVFKPRTRLFAFFDNVNVTQYVTPTPPYINKYTLSNGAITNNATVITVDSTGLFDTSGSITIDSEVIPYTDKTGTTFTGCTRGSGATTHDDNVYVYKTGVAGDPLITGATGKCAGVFNIPDPNISGNPAFKTGERIFRLTSDVTNGILSGDTDTAGETTYFAKGLLDNVQETIIATRNASVSSSTLQQGRVVSSTRSSDKQVGWWDPVAQSFLIDVKGGAFITSVNCYFQSKSETVPLQCQVRTMVNGYPSTTILPFGTASTEPEDVQISEDASLPTLFTFPSPIYLQQDIEYCFVIMANTQDYLIWLSHMGDVEVGGTRTISDQPYAGVLFKSQNASTWSAAQMEDLKFSINRASFSTSDGVVTLQNQAIPTAALGQSPIITIKTKQWIKVRHLNHGMYAGASNYVTLSGLSGSVTITTPGSPDVDSAFNIAAFNKTYNAGKILEVGIDHYILDVSAELTGTAYFAESKVMGGAIGYATENYMMDTGKVVLQLMEIAGSDITTKIRTTTGTSASNTEGYSGGNETSFNLLAGSSALEVSPNENVDFIEPVMVASQENEDNQMSGNKSFEVLATLTTDVENITPVIDTQRMGMICVQNRINNINVITDLYSTQTTAADSEVFAEAYKPKTAAQGDANVAVYITRKISLANSSTSLKVMFDAILFSSAYIDVFYKVLKSDDTTAFDNIEWVLMTIDKAVSESKDYSNFRERAYEVAGLDGFIAFAVKIVMRGTKSTEPPFIKDFRTIALAL